MANITFDSMMTMTRVRLEQALHEVSHTLTCQHLLDPKVDVYYDLMDSMRVTLSNAVWSHRDTVTLPYPATWWDAVKQHWFPAWAVRRWPVVMASVKLTTLAKYPAIRYAGAAHTPYMELVQMDDVPSLR
jgi:hypothetical protein